MVQQPIKYPTCQLTAGLTSNCPQIEENHHQANLGGTCGQHKYYLTCGSEQMIVLKVSIMQCFTISELLKNTLSFRNRFVLLVHKRHFSKISGNIIAKCQKMCLMKGLVSTRNFLIMAAWKLMEKLCWQHSTSQCPIIKMLHTFVMFHTGNEVHANKTLMWN